MKRVKNFKYYLAGSVALATLLVYLPTLRNVFVDWDDDVYIFANPYLKAPAVGFVKWAFSTIRAGSWHPLTWISYSLDYAAWGLNPLGYHLTNIILHAVNTFVVVLLAIKLLDAFKERALNRQSPFLNEWATLIAAGTTGLLFGLHPVHVESVAWVAERKDLLCALFFLLSIVMYANFINAVQSGPIKNDTATRYFHKRYLATLGLFILALLSKPMAVSLPIVLLLLDWFPFNRIRSGRTLWAACAEKLPFFALGLAASIVTILTQRAEGAMTLIEVVPLSTRLLVAAGSLIMYLWKMIATVHLVPYYPYPESISFLSLEYLSAIALVIGITAACMVTAKKQKLWLTAWGYYVVTLIPVLGIVQVGGQSMADRYTYLPSLGPFFIIGLAVAWAWRKVNALQRPGLVRVVCGVAAIFVFAALSYATLVQISIWKNSVTLGSYVIEKEPGRVPFAYYNRGAAYQNLGQLDKALADYNTAIALDPSSSEAYNNRGLFFDQIGQPEKAVADYTMSIILNRSSFVAYNNRGIAYGHMGQLDKALTDYNAAIQLNPYYHSAYLNRGAIFEKQGQYDRAIMDYNAIIAINPNDIDAYNDRGIIYSLFGQYDRALEDFNTALSLNHDFAEAYFNRGKLYSKAGRSELVRADYQKACDLGYQKGCNALQ